MMIAQFFNFFIALFSATVIANEVPVIANEVPVIANEVPVIASEAKQSVPILSGIVTDSDSSHRRQVFIVSKSDTNNKTLLCRSKWNSDFNRLSGLEVEVRGEFLKKKKSPSCFQVTSYRVTKMVEGSQITITGVLSKGTDNQTWLVVDEFDKKPYELFEVPASFQKSLGKKLILALKPSLKQTSKNPAQVKYIIVTYMAAP